MSFTYGHGDRPLHGYTVLRAVGRGAFGEVYFARSDAGREVALKRLIANAEVELRGVKDCMNLKNPHLVTIFDVRTGTDGRPYVIMEYMDGPSLRDELNDNPQGLPQERVLFYLQGIADALSCLHSRGIVHRDLKPENIFLDEGYVKVGDYGLAKHIRVSSPGKQTVHLGTVQYMAPEIATGSYDHRVDLYSLGVILYEMLTGRLPFTGADLYEIALKHISQKPDLKALPEHFRPVVEKTLAKDPKSRFHSIAALMEELRARLPAELRKSAEEPFREQPAEEKGLIFCPAGVFSPRARAAARSLIAASATVLLLCAPPRSAGFFLSLFKPKGPAGSELANLSAPVFPLLLALFAAGAFLVVFSRRIVRARKHPTGAVLVWRLLAATGVTTLFGLCLLAAPYFYLTAWPLSVRCGFGIARFLYAEKIQRLLFALFLGMCALNWPAVLFPRPAGRRWLWPALVTGSAGIVAGLLVAGCPPGENFPLFLVPAFLVGLLFTAGFLAEAAQLQGDPNN